MSDESIISKWSTNELLNELNRDNFDSSMAVLELEENF